MAKLNVENKAVSITLTYETYKTFAAYARERGFSVKKATELALNYAVAHNQASAWLQEFLATPSSAPSKSHDISKDVTRAEIKELTATAVVSTSDVDNEAQTNEEYIGVPSPVEEDLQPVAYNINELLEGL